MNVPFEEISSNDHLTTLSLGPLNEEYVLSSKLILPKSSEEIDLESFFTMAIAQKVSDIHLRIGSAPSFRKNGKILHTRLPALSPKAMQNFARWLIPDTIKPLLTKSHDLDFSIDFKHARLRVNLLYELGRLGFVIRVIPAEIPTLDSLGLPMHLHEATKLDQGLLLMTGATGCGKSTTMASLIKHIIDTQDKHIITIEDPVEFVYKNSKSIVTQRQLGIDTSTFPVGIKHALRQDPDVLLIGEMRDRETAFTAIKAAETGVLVLSTLHTSDAIQTINRIINFFEPHERPAIRTQLSNVLKFTVSQKLYYVADTPNRSAVAEILTITSTIRDYLLKDQLDEIYALMDEGRYEGMQTLNYALYQLFQDKKITEEEALRVSHNPQALQQRIKGAFHGTNLS
jgi:twitching motility protein PilT